MPAIIERQTINQARGFIDALRPTGNPLERWLFRGVANADRYVLLPSAHRDEAAWQAFKPGFDPRHASEAARKEAERELARRFYLTLDKAGFPLPGMAPLTKAALHGVSSSWPPGAVTDLLALAQHYDVPTRLLDWTDRGLVGAYFAALKPHGEEDSHLAVWALSRTFTRKYGLVSNGVQTTIHLVSAPRASNPNLHAQGGQFTYCMDLETLRPLDDVIEEIYRRVREHTADVDSLLPAMRCLRMPRSEAKHLLYLLHEEGVSGLSMFPDLSGVAKHIREATWCERPTEELDA